MTIRQLTAEVKAHHAAVRALGCIVTKHPYPTIHHCHSGSMSENGYHSGNSLRGIYSGPHGSVNGDYLVLPLRADMHSAGANGIDGGAGVKSWETKHGSQVELLDKVSRLLKVNVWELAGAHRNVEGL